NLYGQDEESRCATVHLLPLPARRPCYHIGATRRTIRRCGFEPGRGDLRPVIEPFDLGRSKKFPSASCFPKFGGPRLVSCLLLGVRPAFIVDDDAHHPGRMMTVVAQRWPPWATMSTSS